MNLEHVQAVKARIEEIRRRFIDPAESAALSGGYMPGSTGNAIPPAPIAFAEILRGAQAARPSCPADLEPLIAAASEKYGIEAALIKAVIQVESGFRAGAVSRAGALGLMQLMPGTARALGVDPLDPAQNIDGGTRYLRQQLDRFGSIESALAAYNAGPASVARYGGIPPYAETRRYVQAVLDSIDDYR